MQTFRRLGHTLALGLLLPPAVPAQSLPGVLRPGDPSLRAVCDEPRADTLRLTRRTAEQVVSPVALLTIVRVPMQDRGNDACFVWQTYLRDAGVAGDSALLARRSLAPVWYRSSNPGGSTVVSFGTDSIRQRDSSTTGSVRRQAFTFDQGRFVAPFDLMLFEALPLRTGYRAELAAYNPGVGPVAMRLVVDSLVSLRIGSRDEEAWRLTLDAGAAPTVVWVRRSDGRLLRSRSLLPDGSEFWRIRPGDTVPARP